MTKKDFVEICRDQKFWQWVRQKSLHRFEIPVDIKQYLGNIFNEVRDRSYYPGNPVEYITVNKGSGVLRVIPVFQLRDLCVYYYCVRKLEKYIAVNRVEGTYGGFGISGKLRVIEEGEMREMKDRYEVVQFEDRSYVFDTSEEYSSMSSINPNAWMADWKDYADKLYFTTADLRFEIAAEIDIANFYDAIQLDNLEYKLRKYINRDLNDVVYLLMHFLRYWNRHINYYRQQGAGLPQDLFGECSRVLANFYLQNYDFEIAKYCRSLGARYFRYADDQVFFAANQLDLQQIIAKASSLLMREGLNINQKKVKEMSMKQFRKYHAFSSFLELAGNLQRQKLKKALDRQVNVYFARRTKMRKGGLSLLKRILTVMEKSKIRPQKIRRLKSLLLSKEFLLKSYSLTKFDLDKLSRLCTPRENEKLKKILDESVGECLYTNYLYQLKAFYSDKKINTKRVSARIKWVNNFYGLTRGNPGAT